MKIYFDGGSWCYGSELLNRDESRFSKIVCNKLGAEEYNISQPGGSNAMMERHLLVDHKNIKEFDLVIIQMVYPDRNEYYDRYKKKFEPNANFGGRTSLVTPREKIMVSDKKEVIDLTKKAWLDYYKYIYEDEYGIEYEEMHATAIRSYCKCNNVPLILGTMKKKQRFTKFKTKYDLYFNSPDNRVPRASNNHPNEEGHAIHAQMILDYINGLSL